MDEYQWFVRLYDPLLSPALRPLYREMTGLLARRGCTTVADLCCGTGMLAGLAARTGMDATGVDLSPAMLGVAARKQPARFIRADAAALPLRDHVFDGATISFALHEKPLDTALAILSEARRIVRPGGLVVVADYRADGQGWWAGSAIRLIERMAGRDHHAYFRRYMDKGGTDGILGSAGLPGRCERIFLGGWAGVYSLPVPG
ncbi:MAG: class I SAM-dependent methyltransferase [Desulfovibrionaceae bacterium]|nr:class I SAM-dependent methyltransferase [Desulfovibrionaceae bacterium]